MMMHWKIAKIATLIWTMPVAALANPGGGRRPRPTDPVSVPEIDASSGLLAIATLATVVLFAWERSRRTNA